MLRLPGRSASVAERPSADRRCQHDDDLIGSGPSDDPVTGSTCAGFKRKLCAASGDSASDGSASDGSASGGVANVSPPEPAKKCSWIGSLRDLPMHLQSECAFYEIRCNDLSKNDGCDKMLKIHERASHVKNDCMFRVTQCRLCYEDYAEVDRVKHSTICTAALVPCTNFECQAVIERGDMKKHLALICHFNRCTCGILGCGRKIISTQIAEHALSVPTLHIMYLNEELKHLKREVNGLRKAMSSHNRGFAFDTRFDGVGGSNTTVNCYDFGRAVCGTVSLSHVEHTMYPYTHVCITPTHDSTECKIHVRTRTQPLLTLLTSYPSRASGCALLDPNCYI
jgi:hypothetical protein